VGPLIDGKPDTFVPENAGEIDYVRFIPAGTFEEALDLSIKIMEDDWKAQNKADIQKETKARDIIKTREYFGGDSPSELHNPENWTSRTGFDDYHSLVDAAHMSEKVLGTFIGPLPLETRV